jgi:hypothetical protein
MMQAALINVPGRLGDSRRIHLAASVMAPAVNTEPPVEISTPAAKAEWATTVKLLDQLGLLPAIPDGTTLAAYVRLFRRRGT